MISWLMFSLFSIFKDLSLSGFAFIDLTISGHMMFPSSFLRFTPNAVRGPVFIRFGKMLGCNKLRFFVLEDICAVEGLFIEVA